MSVVVIWPHGQIYGSLLKNMAYIQRRKNGYLIRAHGFFHPRFATVEGTIKDMLRYDKGEIVDHTIRTKPARMGHALEFWVTVKSKQWTPERWQSFGIKTEEI